MNRTAARAGHESGRSDGSRTLTIHDVPTPEAGGSGGAGPSRGGDSPSDGVLRLRGRGDQSDNRRVVWSEGTVDNEKLGRKKSKICCIYHKPKAFDESSDETSSGSDSDSPSSGSDSDSSPASDDDARDDDGPSVSKAMRDKMNGKKRDRRRDSGRSHTHDSADGDACEHHDHSSRSKHSSKSSSKAKRSHKSSSSTMVITEESQGSSHRHSRPPLPPDDDDDDGGDDPRSRPNAYERGPA